MLSPSDIRALCQRKYPAFLRSLLTKEPFFPLKVPFGRPTSSEQWEKLQTEITTLANASLGYRIEWQDVNTRLYGRQRLPQRVWFDDESSFLKALGKQTEVDEFRRLIRHTQEACPELIAWLPGNVTRLLDHASIWPQLILVCQYFLAHPRPGRYARELPIPVDTKFVERNQAVLRDLLDFLLPPEARHDTPHFEKRFGLRFEEPRVHFRVLDPRLQQRMSLPFDDLTVPISQFGSVSPTGLTVLIVENKKTFLSLPSLDNTLAIFGGGGAAELLTAIQWLSACRLLYWGDLDVHGFHILSRLRDAFPNLVSIMMDLQTLLRFEIHHGPGKPATYEEVSHLTQSERQAYAVVKLKGLLLEQERIPHEYCMKQLQEVTGASSV